MPSELTSTNGKKIVINAAGFREAMTLKNAISRELAEGALKIDKVEFENLVKNKKNADIDILNFLSPILKLDGSDVIYQAVFACLARCTFDGAKITEATFEDEAVREDYYKIIFECLKVNLSPFFKGLGFGFGKDLTQTIAKVLK